MKVICVNPGKQTVQDGVRVIVGNEYEVEDIVYGWEVMVDDADKIFYKLVEIDGQVYWEGLFATITEEINQQKQNIPCKNY